jgi:hypothetical protein
MEFGGQFTPGHFTPTEIIQSTPWIGDWVDIGAHGGKQKEFLPLQGIELLLSSL